MIYLPANKINLNIYISLTKNVKMNTNEAIELLEENIEQSS